jgi:hypothetical protein
MTTIKKKYKLGKIKQLIDLNEESVNFDLDFKVTCEESTNYSLLVVDQDTLDNSEELKYEDADGVVSGNFSVDNNVYQNYFLILKSDVPCEVLVEITKIDKPLIKEEESYEEYEHENYHESDDKTDWVKIGIIIAVIIIGCMVLLWMYSREDNSQKIEPLKELVIEKPEVNMNRYNPRISSSTLYSENSKKILDMINSEK